MKQVFIISVVMTLTASGVALAGDPEPRRITYEDFVERVRADKITTLAFVKVSEGSRLQLIEGKYKEGDEEVSFVTAPPLDPAQDPLLTEVLETHGLEPKLKGPPHVGVGEWITQNAISLILGLVPLVLLAFVLIYVIRMNNKIDQVLIK